MPIVHDLVPDVDRRPIFGQSAFDDLDGALHPGTKTPWLGQHNFQHPTPRHRQTISHRAVTETTVRPGCRPTVTNVQHPCPSIALVWHVSHCLDTVSDRALISSAPARLAPALWTWLLNVGCRRALAHDRVYRGRRPSAGGELESRHECEFAALFSTRHANSGSGQDSRRPAQFLGRTTPRPSPTNFAPRPSTPSAPPAVTSAPPSASSSSPWRCMPFSIPLPTA